MRCLLITHPEVVVDPRVPVPHWQLSDLGRSRALAFAASGTLSGIELLLSSTETKAVEAAAVIGDALALPTARIAALGENDRSATGFLPAEEFERAADAFFARPDRSCRGWETAVDAQHRIVGAVREAAASHGGTQIAFVSHGGVGTLLLCALLDVPISRDRDQPRQGCWYAFDPDTWTAESAWRELPEA
jgi:broad specificity phosphatase PhoE